tara:strand:- start:1454 stop:1867 length:414 start_codon:yes stop_codon:yes gene_type:complete
MATKPIKKYIKEYDDAWNEAHAGSDPVMVKGKGRGRRFKTEQVRKVAEKSDDKHRLMRKKPKGMSFAEWSRQLDSGEAMVQNAKRSKRAPTTLDTRIGQKIKPSGPKKPKEFVITTVRDPKAKARAVLKGMAAERKK